MSLCYRRSGPLRPRWDRAGERMDTSSTECLNNECLTGERGVAGAGGPQSQPTTPHLVPSFNTPGRTSSIHRQSVPLSSLSTFPKSVHDCGTIVKYRTYSSGGSYVGIPPPNSDMTPTEFPGLPLVADIPAPGQFGSQNVSGRSLGKDDSITC